MLNVNQYNKVIVTKYLIVIFTAEARYSRTELRINNKDYLKRAVTAIYLGV